MGVSGYQEIREWRSGYQVIRGRGRGRLKFVKELAVFDADSLGAA